MEGISNEAVNEVARNLFDGGYIDYTIERDGSANIDTWNLPDVDDYEYSYGTVDKETLDKAIELLTKLISSVKFYVGDNGASLELNDNHTLWDINAPDGYEGEFDIENYQYLVDQALDDFVEITGVEAYQDGRMGRHIVVDVTFDNMLRFDELKEVQEKLEADVIEKAEAECFPVVEDMTESLNKGEKKARCLSCGADVIYTNRDIEHDIDGDYIECPNCHATFDVDYDAITPLLNKKIESYGETRYEVSSYYDINFRGLESDLETDDYSEAENFIWEKVTTGHSVELIDTETGDRKRYQSKSNEQDETAEGIDDYLVENKKTESYEVWQKYFEDGEIARPEYVQSFDTFEKAQKFADGLNEDPNCEAWVKELKESKKVTEAEDMSKVKDDVKNAVEKSDSTEQEKDQVKGSIDVLKTDEESAIEGYEDFNRETAKVVDKELSDEIDNQMQEIVDDEKEHIEKLDTIKSALGEDKKEEDCTQAGAIQGPTTVFGSKDKELKTEAEGGTIKENLNTGVLPIIDVDMYSLNDEIPESATTEDLDEIVQDIAPKYIKEVIQEVLPSVEIYATGVYHPKQYNFSGDELEFDLVVSSQEYEALKNKVLSDENFNAFLRNNYKSYDGFVSYMATDVSEFETQDTWKQVVQVIMFAIQDEDNFEAIRNEYLDEFLDRVHTEFGWNDEDGLEESKEIDVSPIEELEGLTEEVSNGK